MKLRKIIKNKKGDLPVTLLVIGIFALCGFALLTFFISDFKVSNGFVGASVTARTTSTADEYLFYKNAGMSDVTLKKIFNITTEYGKDYFEDSQNETEGGFLIFGGKSVAVFSIKYQVPSSSFGVSSGG